MFEIGFWELVLVMVIALVVLGPERLPRLVRTVGQWTGRARSYVRHFTAELEREASLQETRQQLGEFGKSLQQPVLPQAADKPAATPGEPPAPRHD